MKKTSFLKVIKGNIKCLFCDNKKCYVRYSPNLEKVELITGGDWLRKVIYRCPKLEEKKKEKILSKPLP